MHVIASDIVTYRIKRGQKAFLLFQFKEIYYFYI